MTKQQIQFLYLVASGNDDGVFKIGISNDPNRRLEQIQETYNVPHAYIVETMDVSTREDVFGLEAALHRQYASKRSRRYGGREWFKLSAADVKHLETLYRQQSNSFAQATAYFGMHQRANEIEAAAKQMEVERLGNIRYNRRFGKTYNTKPKGKLKEYNDLQRSIYESHLGDRFALRNYDHPVQKAYKDFTQKIKDIVTSKLPKLGRRGVLLGAAAGLITGSVIEPEGAFLTTLVGGGTGLYMGRAKRKQLSDETSKPLIAEGKAHLLVFNGSHSLTSHTTAVVDRIEHQSFLVKGFEEQEWNLRNQPAHLPKVVFKRKDDLLQQAASPIAVPSSWVATVLATVCITNGLMAGCIRQIEPKNDPSSPDSPFSSVHKAN